uniref:Putative secreted protein n=1 Tax=Panstrongylus lignarius TaxID=156445 RepID=A0A224XTW1_9HEMI
MANISLKFILLLITAMIALCNVSAGLQDRSSKFFSGGTFTGLALPSLKSLPHHNQPTEDRTEAVEDQFSVEMQ